ncbi:MAG: type II secretion system F family protein [Ilumatobacter sp.]|uniref:type II secretion system F family protein n=1 Tax=Ilumatobacter sp. TaxID=1967498 RepID=UPI003297C450
MMTAAALSSFAVLMILASAGRPGTRSPGSVAGRARRRRASSAWRHRRTLSLAFGAVASAIVLGSAVTMAAGIGLVVWPRVVRISRQRRRRAAIEAALPDAIEMLILVVRAGMTPHQAVSMLTECAPLPIRPAFVEVDRRRARGATLADSLRALPEFVGSAANVVADTLTMSERYGTPIGDALEQLSVDVRERRARHAEEQARKLPIRMSFPLVICTLPSFVLIAIVPAVLGALSSIDTTGF